MTTRPPLRATGGPLHVAIDARIPAGVAGGVQQVVLGLAEGFRTRPAIELRRTWVVLRGHGQWLEPRVPEQDGVLEVGSPLERLALAVATRAPILGSRLRPFYERLTRSRRQDRRPFDRQLEALGVGVVHLPIQDGFATRLPTLYQPHDLQHLHRPEFFTAAQIRHRESVWRGFARAARFVVVGTRWVQRDVASRWEIPAERVRVVALAASRAFGGGRGAASARPVGADPFLLYPAAFWPHKNHAGLVRAVARLRERGLRVRAVFPGAQMGEAPNVKRLAAELGIESRIELPGFVSEAALAELYHRAAVVCVPTLFESASFPIWEAFRAATPVAASRVTSLPEQVGDAGLLFDATDPDDIAAAIERLLRDDDLRRSVVARGAARIAALTWERTALAFSALYRMATGQPPLEDEGAALESAAVL